MKGKLYGIGIGPGDTELITVKGARILGEADIVAIPTSREDRESAAMKIASRYINKETEIITLLFPMIKSRAEKEKMRKKNAMRILGEIDKGKTVACITLGDPMLYSTYIYIVDSLKGLGVEIETVPGITSFCAVGSRFNIPLAIGNENICVAPLNEETDIDSLLERNDNIVFMKVSSDNARLADALIKKKDEFNVMIVSKCGTEEEYSSSNPELLHGKVHYLTTVIAKRIK